MSVAGFDVGNCTSCVALARKRGVDVIMNSESKRETPALVSYGEKQRFVGVDGAAKLMMNVKNTVSQVKRLMGRKFNDPQVQEDIKNFMYKVEEGPDGGCLIKVMYKNELRSFSPEQVMTSLLKDLKNIAEIDQGSAVSDCVVSVPVYFTEAERLAMLNSANLAGLKCLRLMNEPTATALAWGIFKTDLPEDKPMYVAFVDVGHCSLQVSIVAYKKGQMEVAAHAWDRSLGGTDLNKVLVKHFADEFKAKTGLDIYTNGKALFRMTTQVEKCRQVLTVNPEAPVNVECLMEDTDFSSKMTRELFEQLAAPVLERVMKPCQRVLELAGIAASDLASVEMVGAASRTPAIVSTVKDAFGQDPKRTMNSKECVSRGCSLQAAMLSPMFQVRQFDVKDCYPFAVNLTWDKADGETTSQIFGPKVEDGRVVPQALPSVKTVKFFKTEPFSVRATYGDDSDIGPGTERRIADFHVQGTLKAPENASKLATTLTLELDLHGLVRCTKAVHQYTTEVEQEVPVKTDAPAPAADSESAPMDADTPAAAEAAADGDAAPMEADATEAPKTEIVKKSKKVTAETPVEQKSHSGLDVPTYQAYLEAEGEMDAADALQSATDHAKNSLEEYVYSLRSKLYEQYSDYVKSDDRDALIAELGQLEDWLYEEGEDETKSVYLEKLRTLRAKGDPIALRYNEAEAREPAAQALNNYCLRALEWAASEDPKFAHISAEERATVRGECEQAQQWLNEKMQAQSALGKTEPPAVLSEEITRKASALERACAPIMTKPAPAPKKEEPKKEAAKAEEGEAPMEEDAAAEKPAEGGEDAMES